jgi:hypothetical protein
MKKGEMMISKYLDDFIRHSIDSWKYMYEGDAENSNIAHDCLRDTYNTIVKIGKVDSLFALYDHPELCVQARAAARTLEVNEAKALAKLEQLEKAHIPFISSDAKYTIIEWKAGNLHFLPRDTSDAERSVESKAGSNDEFQKEAIESHLEHHLGKIETVYHEIVSDSIHLDILFIPANDRKPFHTLVTCGVSAKPMHVPEEKKDFRFVELMINLPQDWRIDEESFKHESNYWPLRWLKKVGRLPHEFNTWIGWGHTIPNGNPAHPIADTQFTGVMLSLPYCFGPQFFILTHKNGEKIYFYNMVPLYEEEMNLKLKEGTDALERLLNKNRIGHVVNITRKNVADGIEF